MKKGLIASIAVFAAIIGGAVLVSNRINPTPQPASETQGQTQASQDEVNLPENPEYYWGDGCPHCANVAEFLDGWGHTDEAGINKMEVYNSRENANKLQERAAACGMNTAGVGVPFLFTTDGQCIVGDQPIIEYLQATYWQ